MAVTAVEHRTEFEQPLPIYSIEVGERIQANAEYPLVGQKQYNYLT